jgi:hypothetical protein
MRTYCLFYAQQCLTVVGFALHFSVGTRGFELFAGIIRMGLEVGAFLAFLMDPDLLPKS